MLRGAMHRACPMIAKPECDVIGTHRAGQVRQCLISPRNNLFSNREAAVGPSIAAPCAKAPPLTQEPYAMCSSRSRVAAPRKAALTGCRLRPSGVEHSRAPRKQRVIRRK